MEPGFREEARRLADALESVSDEENEELEEAVRAADGVDDLLASVRRMVARTEAERHAAVDSRIREASGVEALVASLETLAGDRRDGGENAASDGSRLPVSVPASAARAGTKTKGTLASGKRSLETTTGRAKEKLTSRFGRSSETVDHGIEEVKYTLQNADPKDSALWGLGVGLMLAQPAVAAGYSTAALLSGAVVSGTAVGAYSSSHEETIFDDIDPMELANRAQRGAVDGKRLNRTSGGAIGAVVGGAAYVAENLSPEEYRQWVEEADADRVLEGAVLGAERFEPNSNEPSTRGAGIGAGFGLLYGYTGDADGTTDRPLEDVLDDDLLADYRARLSDGRGTNGDESTE